MLFCVAVINVCCFALLRAIVWLLGVVLAFASFGFTLAFARFCFALAFACFASFFILFYFLACFLVLMRFLVFHLLHYVV